MSHNDNEATVDNIFRILFIITDLFYCHISESEGGKNKGAPIFGESDFQIYSLCTEINSDDDYGHFCVSRKS